MAGYGVTVSSAEFNSTYFHSTKCQSIKCHSIKCHSTKCHSDLERHSAICVILHSVILPTVGVILLSVILMIDILWHLSFC